MGIEDTLAHLPALRRHARMLTGDATRADDLVQDTLERACVKWSLWQPGTLLRAWLFTLMHHLYLNQRRDWRHDDGHAALEDADEPSHDPAGRTAERLDLQRALAALPPPLREVVLLVDVEEHRYAEAAAILDVPVGTVMSRLHRARERLRLAMSGPAASDAAPAEAPAESPAEGPALAQDALPARAPAAARPALHRVK
ncbi:RNA polymerase sigma factor [Piscinibacter sakaiensis]|uniref:RNA polymerase sigma-54 factor RpoN n=1 Tax=Piscinibacter sakaiensis TaxID=1547922 RepID=A0A0K8P8P8_PISS1|nr:RNA polymerase sigma factor [Piscinibacter sakaiensis]GAP39017.1 RNA polymerase sigma-54 factor RpoN [Piscinibacter sakaiensis]